MIQTLDRIPHHIPPAPMRGALDHMLDREFGSERWTLEAKMDGDRVLIYKHPDGTTEINTRRGLPLTEARGARRVAELVERFPAGMCLEGEWVKGLDTLYLFDLLWDVPAPGRCVCLWKFPQRDRRLWLEWRVGQYAGPNVQVVPSVLHGFRFAYDRWQQMAGCEGVVVKRGSSPYEGSMVGTGIESRAWMKWRFAWDQARAHLVAR